MHGNSKRGVPLQEWAMSALDMEYVEVGRVKEAQARTLDGLGTVAVLLLLFFGLMFI
jgi:hypothetical protein